MVATLCNSSVPGTAAVAISVRLLLIWKKWPAIMARRLYRVIDMTISDRLGTLRTQINIMSIFSPFDLYSNARAILRIMFICGIGEKLVFRFKILCRCSVL